jgi:histidine ammonia-lyase
VEDFCTANYNVASNAVPAWRKHEEAGSALDACLAVLAAIASQALHVTGRHAPPALVSRLASIRAVLSPIEDAMAMGGVLQALRESVAAEVLDQPGPG